MNGMREEVRDLLTQAREDYITAEANIGIQRYYAAVFFCQQAAEKALKALYIHQLRKDTRTHNLIKLSRALEAPGDVIEASMELNPDYLVTRYINAAHGVPAQMFNGKIARRHLGYAERILKWVETEMK